MNKIVILVCLVLTISSANAGIFFEPFAGTMVSGEAEDKGSTCTSDCTYDVTGSTFGLRAGYNYFGFFIGADYRLATYSLEDADIDIKQEGNAGILVGYQLPIWLKVWYVHGISSSLEAETSGGQGITYLRDSSQIFGIGFTGLPFISINFEMINEHIDEYDNSDFGKADADFLITSTVLSVSFPINI